MRGSSWSAASRRRSKRRAARCRRWASTDAVHLHRAAPGRRDPRLPGRGDAARVAAFDRHEHAAEDLPVPAIGPAHRRHASPHAHAGARGRHRVSRRAHARGLCRRDPQRACAIRPPPRPSARARGRWPRRKYSDEAFIAKTRRGHDDSSPAPRCAGRRWRRVTGPDDPAARSDRGHYSYTHYANRQVAEGFDALRFSGPIGRFLLESQEALLLDGVSPAAGRRRPRRRHRHRPSGDRTREGRRDRHGRRRVERDARRRARTRRSEAGVHVDVRARRRARAAVCRSQSFDAAVSLRVLMHTPDWRQCVAELCRVSRWRVIADFPARGSFAALESGARRVAASAGRHHRSVPRDGRVRCRGGPSSSTGSP